MNSEDRVLLHLLAHDAVKRDAYAVPFALCQEGIADAVGVARNTASEILQRLRDRQLVTSERRAISGQNHKRQAFFLSERGRQAARALGGAPGAVASGPAAAAGAGRAPARLPSPRLFVGRGPELARLRLWLERGGGTFLLEGPGGIGKSSLAGRALEAAGLRDPVHVYTFNSLSTLRNVLLHLSEFLALQGRSELATFMAAQPAPSLDQARGALADSLASARGIIILDDAQKIMPEVEPLLERLAKAAVSGGPRLLVIGREMGRVADRLGSSKGFERLTLGVLGDDESHALLAERGFAEREIPEVVRVTRGHPLYLRLVQPGTRPGASRDVQAWLEEEVDRGLGDAERRILLRAAIHRFPVSPSILAPARDEAGPLTILVERGLLIRDGDAIGLHDLLRDYYLRRLPAVVARRLHAEAAQHYQTVAGEGALVESMHHLRAADRDEEAAALAVTHGMNLVSRGYHAELFSVLESFREARVSARQRGWKHLLEARILVHRGKPEQALAAAERSLEVARGIRDPELVALAGREAAQAHRFRGDLAKGIALVHGILEDLKDREGEPYVADLLNAYGILVFESGDREGARRVFEDNVAYALKHGAEPAFLAKAYGNLGETLRLLGRPAEALPHLTKGVEVVTAAALRLYAGSLNLNLAWVLMDLRRHAEAKKHLEAALASVETGPSEFLPEVLWAQGRLLLETGESDRGRDVLRRARDLYEGRKDAESVRRIDDLLEGRRKAA